MWRKFCKSKIHLAKVTSTELFYEGSIAIDEDLMQGADILPYEAVEVWNASNGERFATYAIPLPSGSGEIVVNGAAARKAAAGDQIIIAAFGWFAEEERVAPRVVFVDERNQIREKVLR